MASERELILAKREGYVSGIKEWSGVSDSYCADMAKRKFPLPKVTKPREIEMMWWGPRRYRFVDGKFWYSMDKGDWNPSTMTTTDITNLYELIANPTEEVDGE